MIRESEFDTIVQGRESNNFVYKRHKIGTKIGMKKSKNHQNKSSSLMKQRQRNFIVNWRVADKKHAYNALDDRHTSYYFGSRSVKAHLKKLKKVIVHDQSISKKAADEHIKDIVNWCPSEEIFQFETVDLNCSRERSNKKKDVHNLTKITSYEKEMKYSSIEKLNKTKKNWISRKIGNISPQKYQEILELTSLAKPKSRSVVHEKSTGRGTKFSKASHRDSQVTYYTAATKNHTNQRQSHLPKLSEQIKKQPRVSFAIQASTANNI